MALGFFSDPYMTGLERELTRAFTPYLSGRRDYDRPSTNMNAITAPSFHPMDVVEHPNHFTIIADAPGMTPDDVRIEFQDGMLKVSGEKKGGGQRTEEHAGGRVHRSERTFSSFTRSFALPENAKEDGISATLNNGVLNVNVPKQTPAKQEPRRIKVTSA
ncbi:HSP20-like chaperone [Dunaliella salina]|uniref:HSP20-like chaperone n=1 Tax=Dunaliella salina TaxID=3046 RepID=A0ABQ7H4D9_DUNSA|nr:HSP20-like chaperone [Dunaliella salina]|eukprot:KAF5841719.1 HSP20-like chaperone [Dunaliella salina]